MRERKISVEMYTAKEVNKMALKSTKMQKLGGNPKGIAGRIAGAVMNAMHTKIFSLMLWEHHIQNDADVLDIGCGGGKCLKMISRKTQGLVCGIDHSEEMVKMAKKVNRCRRNVDVSKADVTKLPFEDDSFDVVTAIETIQFWPDIARGLKEAGRVLRRDGRIIIINRFPKQGSKWAMLVKLQSVKDYKNVLEHAGYRNIRIETDSLWIKVTGQR